jgi:uncharacterized protein DUF4258
MQQCPPPRLSPAEAQRKIQLVLEDGTVDFTNHCRRRMRERGVDDLDIAHLLKNGQIIREAEWDCDYQNWKYRVEGTDIEGVDLVSILVIFEVDLSLLNLTVF